MEKIIIFTNFNSLGNISETKREKLSFINGDNTNVVFGNENHFLHLIESEKFKNCKNCGNGNIYFVYDNISQNEFNEFIGTYETNKIGILWHNNDGHFNVDISSYKINKKGQHTSDGLYYPQMLEILTDGKGNEFERLKEKVFKYNPELNAAHEYLYNSINSPAANTILTNNNFFKLDTKISDILLKDYILGLNNKAGLNYLVALGKLRDALFSLALPES